MNIPEHYSTEEAEALLRRQMAMGRYLILGTVLITVVDLICLLCGSNFYISYSMAAAYYPVFYGMAFDNGFVLPGTQVGIFARTGLLIGFLVLAVLVVLWVLAKKKDLYLKIAMVLIGLDALIPIAIWAMGSWESSPVLWELVIHAAVLWEMGRAVSAQKQLQALLQQEDPATEPQTV